jgi:hypothetical protein
MTDSPQFSASTFYNVSSKIVIHSLICNIKIKLSANNPQTFYNVVSKSIFIFKFSVYDMTMPVLTVPGVELIFKRIHHCRASQASLQHLFISPSLDFQAR